MGEKDIWKTGKKTQGSLDKMFNDAKNVNQDSIRKMINESRLDPEEVARRKPLPLFGKERKSENIQGSSKNEIETINELKKQPNGNNKTYSSRRTTTIFMQVFERCNEFVGKMSEEEMLLAELRNEMNKNPEKENNEIKLKTDDELEDILNNF